MKESAYENPGIRLPALPDFLHLMAFFTFAYKQSVYTFNFEEKMIFYILCILHLVNCLHVQI